MRKTAAERQAIKTFRQGRIAESATFNGRFLRDTLDKPGGEDPVAVAVARTVSLLVMLREAARAQAVTADEVQAAIDALTEAAGVETYEGPMGQELYRRRAPDAQTA